MNDRCCGACSFFESPHLPSEGDGECRIDPPPFRSTTPILWCGRFQARPKTPENFPG